MYGDMDDPESLRKALHRANVVFGVTDFWQHLKDPEVQQQAVESGEPINSLAFVREIEQGRVCMRKYGVLIADFEIGAHRCSSCDASISRTLRLFDALLGKGCQ